MSPLQRSLHNVERLTAHPWWTAEETGVKERLKVRHHNMRLHSLASILNFIVTIGMQW